VTHCSYCSCVLRFTLFLRARHCLPLPLPSLSSFFMQTKTSLIIYSFILCMYKTLSSARHFSITIRHFSTVRKIEERSRPHRTSRSAEGLYTIILYMQPEQLETKQPPPHFLQLLFAKQRSNSRTVQLLAYLKRWSDRLHTLTVSGRMR
jgi:hypothetical protein